MKCPYCGKEDDFKVIDKRSSLDNYRRRRECKNCKKRFTTYEAVMRIPNRMKK